MGDTRQYCTFYLDQHFFGIEVLKVQEILRAQHMTHVPMAPPAVSGLINLRGQIITAVDLRARLGLPARPPDHAPMNVVVQSEEGVVSFLVDEIGDVLSVSHDTYEKAPKTAEHGLNELVSGLYKLKDRLLLILDAEKAVDISTAASGA